MFNYSAYSLNIYFEIVFNKKLFIGLQLEILRPKIYIYNNEIKLNTK